MVSRPSPPSESRHALTRLVTVLVQPTSQLRSRGIQRARTSAVAAALRALVETGSVHATDVVVAEVLPSGRVPGGAFVPDAPSSDAVAVVPVAGDVEGAPSPSSVDPTKESPRLDPPVGATRSGVLATEATTKLPVMVPGAPGRTPSTSASTMAKAGPCAADVAQT